MNIKLLEKLGLLHTSPTESTSYLYTTQSTDDIDIRRLLDGRPDYYRQPAQFTEPVKKHIIITDPSTRYQLTAPDYPEVALWTELLHQGFTVSVWTETGLITVADTKELVDALIRVKPIHHDDLAKKLSELSLASKDCYLAGIGQTKQLVTEVSGMKAQYLKAGALKQLDSKVMKNILDCVSGTPTTTLQIESVDDLTNEAFLQFMKRQAGIIIPPELSPSIEQIQTLLDAIPAIENFSLSTRGTDLLKQFYADLLPASTKSLDLLGYGLTWKELGPMLENLSELVELRLGSNYLLKKNVPDNLKWPSTLKVLDFDHIHFNQANDINVLKLFSNLPTLEKFRYVSSAASFDAFTELPDTFLPATLRVLELTMNDLNWSQVMKWTNHLSELEELILVECHDLGDIPEKITLPAKLRVLDVSEANVSWGDLMSLLRNSQSLEKLVLKNFNFGMGTLPEVISLPTSLKELDLRGTKISWEELAILLKACPQIEFLKLDHYQLSNDLPDDLSFLSNIKFLDIVPRDMRTEDKERLKAACQFVKTTQSIERKTPDTPPVQGRRGLDGATGISRSDLTATLSFSKDIPPNIYRKQIFTSIEVNESTVEAKGAEPYLVPYEVTKADPFAPSYTGCMRLTDDKWLPLVSLTARDKLVAIETSPDVELDIVYNPIEALYYVKPKYERKSEEPITISYTIEANLNEKVLKPVDVDPDRILWLKQLRFTAEGTLEDNEEFKKFNELSDDEKIDALISFFNKFSEKDIPESTGHLLLNNIISEMAGVCRHRSIAFLALATAFNLPVKMITNDVHAFVEVDKSFGLSQGEWYRADLGGGEAFLNVIPPPEFKRPERPSEKEVQATATISPDNPFRTWDTVSIQAEGMKEYVAQLLAHSDKLNTGKKNTLCVLNSEQIPAFYTSLFKDSDRSCYFLSDLDVVREKETIINNDDGKFQSTDSALKRFLAAAKPGDVLLVDWSKYESEHVGYNSMMDANRRIKGMPIPPGVIVIGLLDRNQKMGEDFYSRFRVVSDTPRKLTPESVMPKSEVQVPDVPAASVISFYDDAWRGVLLGNITANNGKYHLAKSKFIEAIESGSKTIVLRHAPWHLPEFQLFITELLTKRKLEVNGKVYERELIGLNILRDDKPYNLEYDHYQAEEYITDTRLNNVYILNSMTLNALFNRYQSKDRQLITLDGLLAANKGKPLDLFVTESLSEIRWAQILEEAKTHHTQLRVITAPGIRLPPAMAQKIQAPAKDIPKDITPLHAAIIITNDIDYISSQFADETIKISVSSKTTFADLTGTHKATQTDDKIIYDYQVGILTKALMEGKHVVLKGDISPALAKQLESLFLEPPYLQTNGIRIDDIKGKLTIVSEHKPAIEFVSFEKRMVDEKQKWDAIIKMDEKNGLLLKQTCEKFYQLSKQPPFHFVELQSMLKHMRDRPESNPLKSILRAKAGYQKLQAMAEESWQPPVAKTAKAPKPVMEKRISKLETMLAHDWYVFIAGSSGVGKTTTVNQVLSKMGYEVVDTVGTLLQKLEAWLDTPPGKRKALFIDEANLFESGEFDVLEGLYEIPPKLLINGVYHEVPKDNRLILAGNFAHFKGRQELRFVARHGNVITYKEFDDDFLKEHIMQPVCKSLGIKQEDAENIKDIFLKIYHYINDTYPDKHPITARNLQMMVMRYIKTPNPYMAAYDELAGVLNATQRPVAADWIKKEFAQDESADVRQVKRELKVEMEAKLEEKATEQKEPSSFKITKKRINPVRILDNLMSIRDHKIADPSLAAKGSNGLILEGNPGIGKSLMAVEYLRMQDFVNGAEISREQLEAQGLPPHKRYYLIQAGNIDEVKQTLLKAFHEGAVVIIDEMNTMALEHILNALLSGMTPDSKEPATHPGFFVIGTQNPAHFAKRSVLSDALLNRFQKLDLKDYGKEDLLTITSSMLCGTEGAVKLVDSLIEAQKYARIRKLSPEPTPRDLFVKSSTPPTA